MRQRVLGLVLAGLLPVAAAADSHGWTPEAGPSLRLSSLPAEFVFLSAVVMDNDLITLWERPAYEDAETTDFLGNPLQVNRMFVRCVEQRDELGFFRMQYCEHQ